MFEKDVLCVCAMGLERATSIIPKGILTSNNMEASIR